jgi:hypothetical protein
MKEKYVIVLAAVFLMAFTCAGLYILAKLLIEVFL